MFFFTYHRSFRLEIINNHTWRNAQKEAKTFICSPQPLKRTRMHCSQALSSLRSVRRVLDSVWSSLPPHIKQNHPSVYSKESAWYSERHSGKCSRIKILMLRFITLDSTVYHEFNLLIKHSSLVNLSSIEHAVVS